MSEEKIIGVKIFCEGSFVLDKNGMKFMTGEGISLKWKDNVLIVSRGEGRVNVILWSEYTKGSKNFLINYLHLEGPGLVILRTPMNFHCTIHCFRECQVQIYGDNPSTTLEIISSGSSFVTGINSPKIRDLVVETKDKSLVQHIRVTQTANLKASGESKIELGQESNCIVTQSCFDKAFIDDIPAYFMK